MVVRALLASALVLAPGFWAPQEPADLFVPVGVSYAAPPSATRDTIRGELDTIREAGFNTIEAALAWVDLEPSRGRFRFELLDNVLAAAGDARVKVVLRLDTARPPPWLLRQFPDGRFVADSTGAGKGGEPALACMDHPDVSAAVQAVVRAASERASRHAALYAIDVASDRPSGFCRCRHTQRRYRDWAESRRPDPGIFVRLTMRDHLRLMVEASAARGSRLATSVAAVPSILRPSGQFPQDDWLMSAVGDRYGTTVPFTPAGAPFDALPLGFDGIRSASLAKGWWMRARPVVPEDVRAWGWTALARGARGLMYADARGLGGFAHVITRNLALFGELRPRPAKIAIVYDPLAPSTVTSDLSAVYRALFRRNIQADVIHVDQVAAERAGGYRVLFLRSTSSLSAPAQEALKQYVAAGGTLVSESGAALTDERVIELAARAGVTPDVRIEGGRGVVETRFLESPNVLMLIGLNHGAEPLRVGMTFTLETPEAIWQNMESGSAVNFVAGPDGPVYAYSFRPRDALVLMIRKRIR